MKRNSLFLAIALLSAATSLAAANEASPAPTNGEILYSACAACHGPGPSTKTGPSLAAIVGRKSGTVPGFRYSRALKKADLTWDETTLDRFLTDPQATVPGNAMPYPGLPDPAQRAALIAYLKTLKP